MYFIAGFCWWWSCPALGTSASTSISGMALASSDRFYEHIPCINFVLKVFAMWTFISFLSASLRPLNRDNSLHFLQPLADTPLSQTHPGPTRSSPRLLPFRSTARTSEAYTFLWLGPFVRLQRRLPGGGRKGGTEVAAPPPLGRAQNGGGRAVAPAVRRAQGASCWREGVLAAGRGSAFRPVEHPTELCCKDAEQHFITESACIQ